MSVLSYFPLISWFSHSVLIVLNGESMKEILNITLVFSMIGIFLITLFFLNQGINLFWQVIGGIKTIVNLRLEELENQ